jgi:outer membrane immunogenic protein
MLSRAILASSCALALTAAATGADLTAYPPPPAYVPPPPLIGWTGFYAGLNAGYAFGGQNSATAVAAPAFVAIAGTSIAPAAAASATGVLTLHNSGFIGGGQIGYNWQFANSWLAGIEADIQGTAVRASARAAGAVADPTDPSIIAVSSLSVSNVLDYLGTVRGRLGWLATPALLAYGTGGFAYGGVHQEAIAFTAFVTPFPLLNAVTPGFGEFTSTRPGWTAGGGLEWMVSPNWSVRAEYLYYDLGRTTFALSPLVFGPLFTNFVAVSTRWNGHIARAGINYHFFFGAPPVLAAY